MGTTIIIIFKGPVHIEGGIEFEASTQTGGLKLTPMDGHNQISQHWLQKIFIYETNTRSYTLCLGFRANEDP